MGESGCGNEVKGDSLTRVDVVVKVMVMDWGEWIWR